MGPFKHTVDDGLDLRNLKLYLNVYTLMETCLDQLDVLQLLSHIEDSLKDHYDIRVGESIAICECAHVFISVQILTFLLLVRLSYL